ncbi:hypothetical protein ACFL1F_01130 [Chlamydiota bacterium]
MYSIAHEIIKQQKGFLEKGLSELKPMTMKTLAKNIGVHESTVSRAIAQKYVDTPQGIFQMRYFFSGGYITHTGESVSSTNVKDEILNLIKNEDSSKPLSDQKIIKILTEKGIKIARRTVTKYRKILNILPSNLRKKF